jgi:hypothetical protein
VVRLAAEELEPRLISGISGRKSPASSRRWGTFVVGQSHEGRAVATLDKVARIALALPEVTEGESRGARTWSVGGKTFAWERPYSKADLKRFDDEKPPNEPIVAVRVDDLIEKEAVLAAGTKGVFTIPHFDGYAAVLIELRTVTKRALKDALVDGWLACAPRHLAERYAAKL